MTKYREPRLEVVAYGQELKQYLELPHSRSLYEVEYDEEGGETDVEDLFGRNSKGTLFNVFHNQRSPK